MKHWAFDLIGMDWPEARCWDFVRHVMARQHGIGMPPIANESLTSVAHGWRRCNAIGQDGDIVVMRGPMGRHAGVMVAANHRVGVLHAHRTVLFETLRDLTNVGYGQFEFWRRTV